MIVFSVITVAAILLAFLIGAGMTSKGKALNDAATVQIPVTAKIVKRIVATVPNYQGLVTAGESVTVPGFVPDGAVSAVVVSAGVKPGDALPFGQALGQISGRPIFALESAFPLYRNLAAGDSGSDVLALQRALSSAGLKPSTSGTMDSRTIAAVKAMYERSGFRPPGWPSSASIDMREIAVVPSSQAHVISVAAVGSVLDDTHPFASLQLSPNFVRARVAVLDERSFPVGAAVKVTGPDSFSAEGTVTSVGQFQGATDSQPIAGFDVDVAYKDSATQSPPEATPMSIVAIVASAESLAIPLVAIRQDSQGTYVAMPGKGEVPDRVSVSIDSQADGWAAITSADRRVRVGATVIIR